MSTDPQKHKTLRRFHNPGDYHEFTFGCFQGIALLTNHDTCRRLAVAIDRAALKWQFRITAFVFMPNHVHLMTFPTNRDPQINAFLAAVKQPVAKFARERMEQAKSPLLKRLLIRERPGKWCFRFWQEGAGYDRNLREYKSVDAAVSYIHANPVRKDLCNRPVDWKWSSARYYADSSAVDEELPSIYGLNRENPEIVTEQ